MANTFDDLTIVINLLQLSLGVMLVPAVDHQIVHNNTLPGSNTKSIFYELMGLHETPFTSTEWVDYMQWIPRTQAICLIWHNIFINVMPIAVFQRNAIGPQEDTVAICCGNSSVNQLNSAAKAGVEHQSLLMSKREQDRRKKAARCKGAAFFRRARAREGELPKGP